MTTMTSVLTEAYPRRWSSRDVREGNCSLDLCGSSKRRKPNGELVSGRFESTAGSTVVCYEPEDVLEHIFGDNRYGVVNTRGGATDGKVDAEEARRLWAEWQVRTGRHNSAYAYQFLQEVGLPVEGGLLVRGELDAELAETSGITEAAWRRALDERTFYVHVETFASGERGMFVTCQECRYKPRPTRGINVHSPWRVTSAEILWKLGELAASWFYNHPPRKAEWDCPHVAAL